MQVNLQIACPPLGTYPSLNTATVTLTLLYPVDNCEAKIKHCYKHLTGPEVRCCFYLRCTVYNILIFFLSINCSFDFGL